MYKFISPNKIYYGEGSLDKVSDIIQYLSTKRVYVLIDPILKKLSALDSLFNLLEEHNIQMCESTKVVPEPSLQLGNEIVEEIRLFDPDLVIGIGGGSALDLAKSAAVVARNEGMVENYLNLTGDRQLVEKGITKVLIPTTAGTGSEVTDIAVFSLNESKDVITDPLLLADYAIVDPTLTYTLPARITASSGVDALTHAIESYTSVNATPMTDLLALAAIEKISSNIRSALSNPQDRYVREEMAMGSMLAGLSFYNAGVAGVHALAYPLGGLFKIPHGESNAILLPYVYDSIWPDCIKKMTNVAKALRLKTEGLKETEVSVAVVKSLLDLIKDLGLPTTLKEYDIKQSDLSNLIVNGIKQKRLLSRSPKKLGLKEIESIYTNAYDGTLTGCE
ncbi:iron-containing alcohol dehydrogenase [Bacillus sp. HMF5848]|uniref:iron-containing alcohol dehydrogenase n=1 Tax=Bacillus sp. HMF5848 TaxID=2495421 RepID=UPI000F7A9E24|nr:iron-containing alcohol dehydrogenase [Bacillus sp. HMF5848]RSK27525.1 iron-containing alcohol dehydrogenase [Bacillus sp. HMF5848]